MFHKSIYDLITAESSAYQTLPVAVAENWEWNMADHAKKTIIYKYGQLLTGKTDNKATKNIILPILRLRYRTEGFDVKDIVLFVDSAKDYWKSFLVKKFHERFVAKYKIDTFIDEGSETDIDFGGVLVKDTGEICPEVVSWQSIAFCDQTDILSGPIGIKHQYAPDQLREMASKGWKNIEEVITLAENYKKDVLTSEKQTKTPGKYIEVYEVHGIFPETWLNEGENAEYEDETKYIRQLHICTYYQSKEGLKTGITLFKGKEKELPFKFRSDKIYNRALGFGGVEELIEPQVWTNYGTMRIKDMLDAASKVILQTTDPAFANRNKIQNMENLEIAVVEEGKEISQIDTSPKTMALFDNFIQQMEAHARQTGMATESLMGENPSAGTPFKLQELITATSMGLHEYRMGKFAVFIEEIYRDWIIPHIAKEINKGQEFLSELDLDELQYVADSLVINETNKMLKKRILNGETIYPEEVETYKQTVRDSFMKGGNKRFIEILKDELKDAPIDIRVSIKGKQKELAKFTDKLVNIFRFIIGNPQGFMEVMKIPGMAKTFNEILEFSGMSPQDFSGIDKITQQQQTQPQPTGAPVVPPQLMPQPIQ